MGSYREGTLSYLGRFPELLLHSRSKGKFDRVRSREIQHTGSVQSMHDRRISPDGRYDHCGDVTAEWLRVSPVSQCTRTITTNRFSKLRNVPPSRVPREVEH
jgi:hypothetical protein